MNKYESNRKNNKRVRNAEKGALGARLAKAKVTLASTNSLPLAKKEEKC